MHKIIKNINIINIINITLSPHKLWRNLNAIASEDLNQTISVSVCLSVCLSPQDNVEYIAGHASFTGPKEVTVGDQKYTAEHILIATGTKPIVPDVPGERE